MAFTVSAVVATAVGTLGASLATGAWLVRIAPQRRKADRPPLDERERARVRVPRAGGTAVFISVVAGVCLLNILTATTGADFKFIPPLGIVLGATLIFSVGLIDDVVCIAPKWKLAGQSISALLAWIGGFQIHALSMSADSTLSLGVLALPVTMLWLVTAANAVNLIDGLDGLVGGYSTVVLATAGAIGLVTAQNGVVVTAVVGLAAMSGFLRYNARSARMHLGDSGSLFAGFSLGILVVEAGRLPSGEVITLVPLALLALPIADIALAVVRRTKAGVPLTRGDSRHVHHRLLSLGLSEGKTVFVLVGAAAICGAAAFALLVMRSATPGTG